MSQDDRPLPEPPSRPFGRTRKKRGSEDEEKGTLLADRLAAAAAEGRLEEFVAREFPDNERARSLAMTMMSLTGMVPGEAPQNAERKGVDPNVEAPAVPEGVDGAAARGDVGELIALLAREQRQRSAETAQSSEQAGPAQSKEPLSESKGGIEKETLDSLLRIASKEEVSLDWLIGRALALYVRDYNLTGRL